MRNFVTRVNGGEDFHVKQTGKSAPRTRTVLDRANVAYILVVPTVRQEYLYIKVTTAKFSLKFFDFIDIQTTKEGRVWKPWLFIGESGQSLLISTEMMFVEFFSGHNRRLK